MKTSDRDRVSDVGPPGEREGDEILTSLATGRMSLKVPIKTAMSGIVVGIYGIQGVGKSHVLKRIASQRCEWRVVDGSQLVREELERRGTTMEQFETDMPASDKADVRRRALEHAKLVPGVTLVAGHCSFPRRGREGVEGSIAFSDVFTPADGNSYSHVIYVETSPEKVFDQVRNDQERTRRQLSIDELRKWMEHEKETLAAKCREHDISYDIFRLGEDETAHEEDLLSLIVRRAVIPRSVVAGNESERALVASIAEEIPEKDVYLLIDGDGTLCAQDTGAMFFEQASVPSLPPEPLKHIFQRFEQYTFQAFWEVAMLYTNVLSKSEYTSLCKKVGAKQVQVFEAWREFLNQLPSNVHPILVSCSIREVWLAMQSNEIENHGQSSGFGRMTVIAGNTLLHPYLVDDYAKFLVATTLRNLHGGCHIISFGDSGEVPFSTC